MLAITKKFNILTRTVQEGMWDYAVTKPVHRIQNRVFWPEGVRGDRPMCS